MKKTKIQLEGKDKEFVSMVKRNIMEGMSVDNAFRATVKLPHFFEFLHPQNQSNAEIVLFGKILSPEESSKEPYSFFD